MAFPLRFVFLALASLGVCGAFVACTSEEASPLAPTPADASPAPPADAAPGPGPDAGDAGDEPDVPPPASLVTALSVKPYVEDVCEPTTYPGWPYEALSCTYRSGLQVTVADPPPDRVARWIVTASSQIDALESLRTTDPAGWEEGLVVIAKHTLGQSSRIFPLEGQVYENGTAYKFERGVTKTCKSGCYCRINSTSRYQWCKYAGEVLGQDEQQCLVDSGQTTSTLTESWLAKCLANHVASWTSSRNENYVAQAWNANVDVKTELAKVTEGGAPTKAQILAALKAAYP